MNQRTQQIVGTRYLPEKSRFSPVKNYEADDFRPGKTNPLRVRQLPCCRARRLGSSAAEPERDHDAAEAPRGD